MTNDFIDEIRTAVAQVRANASEFHREEDGLSTVEMLLLLLLGLIVLAAIVKLLIPNIWNRILNAINNILNSEPTQGV